MTNKIGPFTAGRAYCGDLRELGKKVPDRCVDLIMTDPPYVAESLYTLDALAAFAARVLRPDGFLVFYMGTYYLQQAFAAMTELEFFWQHAIVHGNAPFVWARKTFAKHKSVLVFRPRGGKGTPSFRSFDVYTGGQESKSFHKWGQSQHEAAYFVDLFSAPGAVVVDPFSGGGTTAVVCKGLKRRWLAFDIDEAAIRETRNRVANPLYSPARADGQLSFAFAGPQGGETAQAPCPTESLFEEARTR